jgi:beta-mannosidase
MQNTLDLGGDWMARWFDGWRGGQPHIAERPETDARRWLTIQVPGEIHLDLARQGLIADPYVGGNVLAARWVEECQWAFRRSFTASPEARRGRCWLVFERLELVGRIMLNGTEVGRHANAFHPCRIDLTGKLREGENQLVVHLEAGLFDVSEKPAVGYLGFQDQRLHKRHWLRAPQSQFGWDWSPRLANVGITAPCRLEWTEAAVRLDQVVPLATVSDDLQQGFVTVRAFVEGLGSEPVTARLSARLPGLNVAAEAEIRVAPGVAAYEVALRVDRPQLWWPVGHGEATLHELRVELRAGEAVAERRARIGFRRARFDQSPDPAGGRLCVLEINNRRVFAKGGNFVPADIVRAAITRERYATLIDRALEANHNLLRVWGGGLYEDDAFYELCDERGILVWQEFIFACGRYPGQDEAFWNSVKTEATWNVRRLAGHAALIVWCGNNENEWGAWEWGFDRNGAVLPDHAIYHHLLPRIVAQEDGTRHWQPSSPWSPDGLSPNRDDVGDQHPWGTVMADGDWRGFRAKTCRFANEGGFLGPNAWPTLLECLPEGQRRIGSLAWDTHDNAVTGWFEPCGFDAAFRAEFGLDPREIPLERWYALAGRLHGEALAAYCDAFRARMFASAAAVFWMYNDCWPTTRSWTIVDHRLRRTPAFHHVRRALAPIGLVVAEANGEIIVTGINDSAEAVSAELRFGVMALAGGWPVERTAVVTLAPNAATRLGSFAATEWKDPRASLAAAVLTRGGEVIARNRLMRARLHEHAWPTAHPTVTVHDGVATFTSDTFAWAVCIDHDGERPVADNHFDLWPGLPHRIPWPFAEPPRIFSVGMQEEARAAAGSQR